MQSELTKYSRTFDMRSDSARILKFLEFSRSFKLDTLRIFSMRFSYYIRFNLYKQFKIHLRFAITAIEINTQNVYEIMSSAVGWPHTAGIVSLNSDS